MLLLYSINVRCCFGRQFSSTFNDEFAYIHTDFMVAVGRNLAQNEEMKRTSLANITHTQKQPTRSESDERRALWTEYNIPRTGNVSWLSAYSLALSAAQPTHQANTHTHKLKNRRRTQWSARRSRAATIVGEPDGRPPRIIRVVFSVSHENPHSFRVALCVATAAQSIDSPTRTDARVLC